MSSKLMSYERMTKPTPQEEWIQGKGLLLWLAFFFSEIGAGIYLVSLFLNFRTGWLVGWLVSLVLGGLVHMAYLGSPMRSWRMLLRPATSEISRGLWAVVFFAGVGFFQVAPVLIPGLPWEGSGPVLKTIMGILCILLIAHGFLTMSVVRALPLWNSSMMIPLSIVSGLWVGSQTVEIMMFASGVDIRIAEMWSRWSLLGYMGISGMYLFGTAHTSTVARASVNGLLRGESALRFYVGVIVIGIIIPLMITFVIWGNDASKISGGVLFLRFVCVLVGDLAMRHNIMRSALYAPVI